VRSVGHGTLDFVFAPGGSKPGGTANLLIGLLISSHAAFKLRHLGPPPKLSGMLVAACRPSASGADLSQYKPDIPHAPAGAATSTAAVW
jgi:hypothetical protein